MATPAYTILRFAKYKGPEISRIEAHNERTKEKYASNPDVDVSRSRLNIHLIEPTRPYRAEAERQIMQAGCRTRSDSVRLVEALIAGSPAFFEGKSDDEITAYFKHALIFLQQRQAPETFVSAVIHMDEKTPHMHVAFVPLTPNGRLSAKEIIGNRQKLVQWQDDYWRHMMQRYPELERGESAAQSGRKHLPPALYKEAAHLNRQAAAIDVLLNDMNPFNTKKTREAIAGILKTFIPQSEHYQTVMKQYDKKLKTAEAENIQLSAELKQAKEAKFEERMEVAQLQANCANMQRVLARIPPEVIAQAKTSPKHTILHPEEAM